MALLQNFWLLPKNMFNALLSRLSYRNTRAQSIRFLSTHYVKYYACRRSCNVAQTSFHTDQKREQKRSRQQQRNICSSKTKIKNESKVLILPSDYSEQSRFPSVSLIQMFVFFHFNVGFCFILVKFCQLRCAIHAPWLLYYILDSMR